MKLRDPKEFTGTYWKNRWEDYLKEVIELALKIEPLNKVLEIGPKKLPLFIGSDTLDICGNPTYKRDATNVPYPINNKEYDLIIATQVWEHLGNGQRQAFEEVKRISKNAIFSFPYMWGNIKDMMHYGIDQEKINYWTCDEPYIIQKIVMGKSKAKRLIRVYNFK